MVRALATSDLTMSGTLTTDTHTRALRLWLYAVAALVLAMVLVGGATRLTESGLSITEWKPVMGVVPPLSQNAWQAAFEKYQAIPQYREMNRGMWLSWRRRSDGATLGRNERQADCYLPGTPEQARQRRVQPGRRAPGDKLVGQDGSSVGHQDGPGNRAGL